MVIPDEMVELGKRIRAARAYSGLSSQELADRIGASRASICKWEKGLLPKDRRRREDIIRRVAETTAEPKALVE